jgi:hypothetical protein
MQEAGIDVFGDKRFATHLSGEGTNESNTNTVFNQLCAEPIPGETVDLYVTEAVDQSVDSFLSEENTSPPVNVLGTSFTDEAKPYNFSGFLREYLRSDVATYSISGGGVETSLYKWAFDGLAASAGAKAIVWEMPYPERLEPIAASLTREIIPAIAGSCDGSAVFARDYMLAANGRTEVAVGDVSPISGEDFYIDLTLSDPSLRSLAITFTYADGRSDLLPVVRPDRIASAAHVFGQLSGEVAAPLVSVAIENSTASPESGRLSICAYPKGIWKVSALGEN